MTNCGQLDRIFKDENQYTRRWRTLCRVTEVENDTVWIIIPAWNSSIKIGWNLERFPKELIEKFEEDYMFFARVNIGVEDPRMMIIEGEFEYE